MDLSDIGKRQMTTTIKQEKLQTLTLNELSAMINDEGSKSTTENINEFVVHRVMTDKGTCTIFPSPNDQVFFLIWE